jgi:RNA polymerase sigma-70 factor (ECF subfamily)
VQNSLHRDPQEYVVAFQHGEEAGFNYFFTSLYPALVYYAGRILGDRPAAEDIVEESFIKIWERHTTFTHPNVIKSWLYTTVRNACLSRLQQEQRNSAKRDALENEYKGRYENSVLHEIIRAEVISEVHAHIESLPAECRKQQVS